MTIANESSRKLEIIIPDKSVLDAYPFIYATPDQTGRVKPSFIKGLPSDPVLTVDEVLGLAPLLSNEDHMIEAGLVGGDAERSGSGNSLLTPYGERTLGQLVMAGQQAVLGQGLFSDGRRFVTDAAVSAHSNLVRYNEGLVKSTAQRFLHYMDFDDAWAYGTDGLIRAAAKFDYRTGYRFTTYAGNWIRQAMGARSGHVKPGETISLPKGVKEDMRSLLTMRDHEKFKDLTDQQIAAELGWGNMDIRLTDVAEARIRRTTSSIDAPVSVHSAKSVVRSDIIADSSATNPEEYAGESEVVRTILLAINNLEGELRDVALHDLALPALGDYASGNRTALNGKRQDRTRTLVKAVLAHPSQNVIQKIHNSPEATALAAARCKGEAYESFLGARAQYGTATRKRAQLCGSCPVKAACLAFADQEGITVGYWGGVNVDPKVREALARKAAYKASVVNGQSPVSVRK